MAKAKIVLAPNVFKIIQHFTKNLNTEIGAVGTGSIKVEDKEKYFYIDKLYFPDQNVTGATVHFKPEHWGSIIKQMPKEDLGRICFYWHRHPGSATHSHTDEEDTFNVFMDKESGRKYFVFMQTAWKGTEMEFESRIDLATPVRATVFDKDIEVIEEMTEQEGLLDEEVKVAEDKLNEYRIKLDEKIKIRCAEIEAKSIIKQAPVAWARPSNVNPQKSFYGGNNIYNNNTYSNGKDCIFWKGISDKLRKTLEDDYKVLQFNQYVDNDFIGDTATAVEEKASVKCENGCILVKAGTLFNKVMINSLGKNGMLHDLVKRTKYKQNGILTEYLLTPAKQQYLPLKSMCLNLLVSFGTLLKKDVAEQTPPSKADAKDITEAYTIENQEVIEDFFDMVNQSFAVVWIDDPTFAQILDMDTEELLGNVYVSEDLSKVSVTGDELVSLLAGIESAIEYKKPKAIADKTTIESKLKEGKKCKKKKSKN